MCHNLSIFCAFIVHIVSWSNNEGLLLVNTIWLLKNRSEWAWLVSGFSRCWSVRLSFGVWPLYCGRLTKFSAFYYTSFIPQPGFLSFLLPVITPWYLYIDKKCVPGVQFSGSPLNTETRRIIRTLWLVPLCCPYILTVFHCFSDHSMIFGNYSLKTVIKSFKTIWHCLNARVNRPSFLCLLFLILKCFLQFTMSSFSQCRGDNSLLFIVYCLLFCLPKIIQIK